MTAYTDAQLRAAWLACKRASWPATFEEAMADAQYSRLVRLHAWLIAHPRESVPLDGFGHFEQALPRPPRLAPPPPGWVDHKRAAGGDRDDD